MTCRRELRLQAMLCALAVVVCALVSLPFTTMGVGDDGPYIRMAQTFANTGHIVYNGWAAPMMAAQLYLAAVFIKLFGFSTTSVRMSTLLLAALIAFVFHRTLVRTGSSERNATLGTLAIVISPLYLMLSATFMTDIAGLLATTLCLYGCVRAIQTSADRSSIGWICFAAFTCAVFGTSRQIAWLGNLVMVPCTLWLLRSRAQVLFGGAVATAVSFLFILGCMHWLANQPYVLSVPLFVWSLRPVLGQLSCFILEIPFLVLPVIAVFSPQIFRGRPYTKFLFLTVLAAYVIIALLRKALHPILYLEPTGFGWVNVSGVYTGLEGSAPVILRTKIVVVLTIVCIGGLLGVIALALQAFDVKPSAPSTTNDLSWYQLGILLLPFSIVYLVVLIVARPTPYIFDRYALELLSPTMIVLVRLYQRRVQPSLPFATVLLIIVMGAYGIIATHNTFALDRARVDLVDELHASGVPFTSIDGGWDYNLDTELKNSDHIIDPGAYVIPPPAPPGYCQGFLQELTPHVRAVYGLSFSPNTCYGRASFAPVQYRHWPSRSTSTRSVMHRPPS